MEEAIQAVMFLYDLSREDAIQYYSDEIEAHMRLTAAIERMSHERTNSSSN